MLIILILNLTQLPYHLQKQNLAEKENGYCKVPHLQNSFVKYLFRTNNQHIFRLDIDFPESWFYEQVCQHLLLQQTLKTPQTFFSRQTARNFEAFDPFGDNFLQSCDDVPGPV